MSKPKSAKEKTLQKIRKLFDLAESNTSKEEMSSALEQARKLLRKYSLTMEEVNQSRLKDTLGGGDGWTVEIPRSEKVIWINHLAAVVGEYFECKIARDGDVFVFFGPSLLVNLASYGFQSVYNQILELSGDLCVSQREYFVKGAMGQHSLSSYAAYCKQAKYEYRTGLAIGLEQQLHNLKEEEIEYDSQNKMEAIVVASWDVADKWAEANDIVVRPDKVEKEQKHKVTGTEHCTNGVKDSKKLTVKKGLEERRGTGDKNNEM